MKLLKRPTREDLLSQVDVPLLYAQYGIGLELQGDQYVGYCCFHADHGRPNLSVSLEGTFHCFSCGAGGSVIDFVALAERPGDGQLLAAEPAPDKREIAKAFARIGAFVAEHPQTTPPPRATHADPPPIAHAEVQAWVDALWNHHPTAVAFLTQERGISEETLRTHGVGYDDQTERITIPVYDLDGQIVNVRKYRPHAGKGVAKVISYAKGYGRNRRLSPFSGAVSPILLLAGEMDYLLARSLGYVGADTFTAGESSLPTPDLVEDWVGKPVHIWYDHDDPGRQGAQKLAAALYDYGVQPHLVGFPPKFPEGQDFTDLVVGHGYTREGLDWLIEQAKPWEPPPLPEPAPSVPADPAPGTPPILRTEFGLGRRLVNRYGENMRYVPSWGKWLVWNNQQWERSELGQAERCAKDTIYALREELPAIAAKIAEAKSDQERKDLEKSYENHLKFMAACQTVGKLEATLKAASTEDGMSVSTDVLDQDPWLINCANGVLDLHTGTLREHDRSLLLSKLAPVAYRPDAKCPLWEQFLLLIMDNRPELVAFLQRALGYALTGDVSEQKLFFLYGTGENGKSTLINTIRSIVGDYGRTAAPNLLVETQNDRHPTELADLHGARFLSTIETEQGKRMAEALVKQLTGNDEVKARFLFQDFFNLTPTWKIFLAANYKPVIRGNDWAIWRRICLIPFDVTISQRVEKDEHFGEKLAAEREGIFAWLVRGCLAWQREGLGEPDAVKVAIAEYRTEQDALAAFLLQQTVRDPNASVSKAALYTAWDTWRARNNERVISSRDFLSRMKQHGYVEGRDASQHYVWLGLTLKGAS